MKVKLRLRADCGLQQGLLQWEKLPVSQEFIGKWAGAEQASCTVPSLGGLDEYLRPRPLNNLSAAPRQRNMAQMKEQSKTAERELNDEEIA